MTTGARKLRSRTSPAELRVRDWLCDTGSGYDLIAKGIVKFLVDIYDESNETVGIATILTMVKKIDQSKFQYKEIKLLKTI